MNKKGLYFSNAFFSQFNENSRISSSLPDPYILSKVSNRADPRDLLYRHLNFLLKMIENTVPWNESVTT